MRKLIALFSAALVVALVLPGSIAAVDAQSGDCQMIGWTGQVFVPPESLNWTGDVENVDGTVVRGLDGITAFGWSPDGIRFAYVDTSTTPSVLHVTTGPLGTGGVEVAGISGSSVVWSPSGDRVLVSDGSNAVVAVVALDGSVVELDSDGRDAAWSSDGDWVGWTGDDGIDVAHPDGSGATVLVASPANGLLWRPGTHQLLTLAPSFLIADADTLALIPITIDPINFANGFAWSPDGTALAWAASADGTAPPRIWVDAFDSAGAQPISPLLPSAADAAIPEPFSAPFWSPDGSQIAAGESSGSWAAGFSLGPIRVRLLPSDGSSDGLPLTEFVSAGTPINVSQLVSVAWSPDHHWVAVAIQVAGLVGGSSEFFVNDSIAAVDGSSTRDLGSSFRARGHVEWWPVVGVDAAAGACVLASEETETPASTAPATRPQFTG